MMILADDEKAMLDGEGGAAKQKAMELLVRYAEALGAERFVDTSNIAGVPGSSTLFLQKYFEEHAGDGSFEAVFSLYDLDGLPTRARGAPRAVVWAPLATGAASTARAIPPVTRTRKGARRHGAPRPGRFGFLKPGGTHPSEGSIFLTSSHKDCKRVPRPLLSRHGAGSATSSASSISSWISMPLEATNGIDSFSALALSTAPLWTATTQKPRLS